MTATTYPSWLAGQAITAGMLNSMLPLQVVKPADESVTSNATLQNDNDLLAAVVANAVYEFRCSLEWEGPAAVNGIQFAWAVPAGATMRYTGSCFGTGGGWNGITGFAAAVQTSGGNGAGSVRPVFMDGSLTVSGTAGSLQLQWAQITSNATPTIVHGQSSLSLQRVA